MENRDFECKEKDVSARDYHQIEISLSLKSEF